MSLLFFYLFAAIAVAGALLIAWLPDHEPRHDTERV